MIRSSKIQKGATVRARAARGFTLLELVIVVAIGMILAGMAIPFIGNTLRVYRMRSAVTSVKAPSFGLRAAMRSSVAATMARALTSPERTAAAIASAEPSRRSALTARTPAQARAWRTARSRP